MSPVNMIFVFSPALVMMVFTSWGVGFWASSTMKITLDRERPDVGERRDLNFALVAHVFNGSVLPLVGSKLVFDEVQVVEQGLHVRVHLFLRIAGEVAQILLLNATMGRAKMIWSKRFFCSSAPARAKSVLPVPATPQMVTRLMSGF